MITRLSAIVAVLLSSSAFAQDYTQYEPKSPPSAASAEPIPMPKLAARDDANQILVRKLEGVVFVDSRKAVNAEGTHANGIVTNDIPLLQGQDFQDLLTPFLGRAISQNDLRMMVNSVVLYCRQKDRPVVDVAVPPQDVTNGVVQLVFIEGRVGKVEARGNRYFSAHTLTRRISLEPGEPISAKTLVADLARVNQNSFHQSHVVFTPGSDVSQTDIVLQTQDRFPVRPYAGYENTGNELTGRNRYIAGLNWGNVFGWDQQLNYQYTTSLENSSLTAHSASYVAPLPWLGARLVVFGASSKSEAVADITTLKGSGDQAGFRYELPLPTKSERYQHSVQAGYDWKRSNNSLEFGSIPLSPSVTEVGQFVLGYTGTRADRFGSTTFSPQFFVSPIETFSRQNEVDYELSRAGTSPKYVYGRLAITRVTKLPWSFSLNNELTVQYSNKRLLPSEQLQFGGYDSIRGYNEWDLSGTDQGAILRTEVRAPAYSVLNHLGLAIQDQVQLMLFVDYGMAKAKDGQLTLNDGTAHSQVTMGGAGAGLRYAIGPYLSVRGEWATQLRETGDDKSSRFHVGVVFGY